MLVVDYAAIAQKERELISERTGAALAAARARRRVLGRQACHTGPDSLAAALVRRQVADQAAHRLLIEV